MSHTSSTAIPVGLVGAAGFLLVAIVMLSGDPGYAQSRRGQQSAVELPPVGRDAPKNDTGDTATGGTCSCPGATTPVDREQRQKLWPKPSLAELKAALDESDAIAALEAVQVALTEVGDGATYIWHRRNGRLSGAVQPTGSFKDATGQVCRHIVVALTSGMYSRKAEGIACRQRNGVWNLEG
jgi:surface antigen